MIIPTLYISLTTILILITSSFIPVEGQTSFEIDTCHVSGAGYSVNENHDLILPNSDTDYTFAKFTSVPSAMSLYTIFQLEVKNDNSIISFYYGTNSSIVSEMVFPDALQIVFVMNSNSKLNKGIHLIDSWGSIVYTWNMPAVGLHSFELLVSNLGYATVTIDTVAVQSRLVEYEAWAATNKSMFGILVHTDDSPITIKGLQFQNTLSDGTISSDRYISSLSDCQIVKSQTLNPIKYIGMDSGSITSNVNFNNVVQTLIGPNSILFSKVPGNFNIATLYPSFLGKNFKFSFDLSSISLLDSNFDFIVALGQSASESAITGSTNANLVFRFTNDQYTVTGTGISESFTPTIKFGYKFEFNIEIKTFGPSLYYINLYVNGRLIFSIRKDEPTNIFTSNNGYFSFSSSSSFSVILSNINLELSDIEQKITDYTNLKLQEVQYMSTAFAYPQITNQGDIELFNLVKKIWGTSVGEKRWQDLDSFTLSFILYDTKLASNDADNACFYFGAKRYMFIDNTISGGFGLCFQIYTKNGQTKVGLSFISPYGEMTIVRPHKLGRTQGADIKLIYRKSSSNSITVFVDAQEFNFDISDFDHWLNFISGSYYGMYYRAGDNSSLLRFGAPRIFGYNSTHYEDYNFNSTIPRTGINGIFGSFTLMNGYYSKDKSVIFEAYVNAGTIDDISPENGLSLLLHTWKAEQNKFAVVSKFNLNYRKVDFSYTFVYISKDTTSKLYDLVFGLPDKDLPANNALIGFTIYRNKVTFLNSNSDFSFSFIEGTMYNFNFEYINNLDFTSSIKLTINGGLIFERILAFTFNDTISSFGVKSDSYFQQLFFENIALSYEDKVVDGEVTIYSTITDPNPTSTTITSTATQTLNYSETSIIGEYLTEVDISISYRTDIIGTTTQVDETILTKIEQATSTIELSETEIEVLESLIELTITSESVFYAATSTDPNNIVTSEVWTTVSTTTSTATTEVLTEATTTVNLIDTLSIEGTILTRIEQTTSTIELAETEIEVLESLIELTITSESVFYAATSTDPNDIVTSEVWTTVSTTTSTATTEVLAEATTTTNLINTLITVDDTITINPSYTNTVSVLNTEIIQVENEILLTVSSNIIYSTQTNIGNTYFQTNTYYESYSTTKTSIIETNISSTTINIQTLNTVTSKTIYETVLSTSSNIVLITSIETVTNIPDANPVNIGLISGLAAGGLLLVGVASASAYYIHNKGYVSEESKFVQGNGFVHDNPFYQPQREYHENELYTPSEISTSLI